jgi:uncharacterized phage protein gp47/JayE
LPYVKKTYRQIAKDILTQICGGETTEEHGYVVGKTSYKLSNTPVTEVKAVEGTSKGSRKLFVKDTDYRFIDDSVEWLGGGDHPDEDTSFTVQYAFSRQSIISDVNPGSVVRTIAEAISREIEYLYLQMEEAYLSGFLDTATGNALDMVISILGIKRKPPQPSSGYVTFGRSTEPEILAVTGEVHLYDGSLEYALNKPLIKEITKIEGTIKEAPVTFEKNVDYVLAGKNVRWLPEGKKPDTKTVFRVDYSAYREIVIPKGTSVTTFSPRPEETRLFTTVDEASLAVTKEDKWETEIPVVCTTPGRWGNVLAGTVTVMPQPIAGVEYVINKADVTNGVEVEGDSELRERAKHALEFAGKATYSSLESAIRSVEGVRSLLIQDMPEKVSGIVKVIVDGGDMDRITHIINETRAAGIKVEVFRPKIVYINVSLTLMLEKDVSPTQVATEAEKQIRSYVSSLEIGDDVLFSRIIESALIVGGVWDVKNVRISARRVEGEIVESERENIDISSEERAEPRTINISFEMKE